ncbi:hypothetical protein PQX77_018592 [Marasmius sp. AFHP31]|nr:hypothetical protein PQX77_018592 [Marasmius sp. AFHP31]
MRPSTLLLSATLASAGFTLQRSDDDAQGGNNSTPRIAIVGAGAGGSSAAFWIAKAKERFGVDVEIDVYEQNSYVGGRSIPVHPNDDPELLPVETGASIFVRSNKNLWRATQEFNLTLNPFGEDDGGDTGYWDGEKLVLTIPSDSNGTELLLRYGADALQNTDAITTYMNQHFLGLYNSSDTLRWENIASLVAKLGLLDLTGNSTANYFESNGVSAQFVNEIVEGALRINYGQNADKIHAMGGAVSLSADGASQVTGGNYQIFENFLKYSGATVYLNTKVTAITSEDENSWTVRSAEGSKLYKGVILAAPLHQTGIDLPPSIVSQVPEQPYVHLHVTLFSTTSPSINPEYVSLPPNSHALTTLLTTYQGARDGGKAPEFNSLDYQRKIGDSEWVVKIFSEEEISDEWLNETFSGQVGWVYRKEWDAYPRLFPTTSFPPVKLGSGFYYVNALEPFISTMETETVASRNVVDQLLIERFNASVCGPEASVPDNAEDFVFGWDC